MLIGSLLLLALLIFIIWDVRRPARPHPSSAAKQQDTKWMFISAFAFGCAVYGVLLWTSPPTPPFDGRVFFQAILEFSHLHFGEKGPAIIWFSMAVICGVGAVVTKRKTAGDIA
jgi:drug/metabolite transporter (DMT)-like permease